MRPGMKKFEFLLCAALLGGAATMSACGDDEDPQGEEDVLDEETDGGDEPIPGDTFVEIPRTDDGPGAGTDGQTLDGSAPESGARVGRHPEDVSLFGGIEARCRPGDWVLENTEVRACIEGLVPANQIYATGGKLIDLVDIENPVGDTIEFFGSAIGLREAGVSEIRVINDGSDGGPAVIRTSGVDVPLKLMIGTLGTDVLARPVGVTVETEYRLAPDSRYVEIVTWIALDREARSTALRVSAGDASFTGDLNLPWTTPNGFGNANRTSDLLVLVGEENVYGYRADVPLVPGPDLSTLTESIYLNSLVTGQLGSESEATFRRYLTIVEGGSQDVESALGDDAPEGIVMEFDLEAGPGWGRPIWSIADDASGDAVALLVNNGGTANATLPAGDYTATPVGWPQVAAPSVSFTVESGATTVVLEEPGLIAVDVEVADSEGPLGARLRFTNGPGQNREFYVYDTDEVAVEAGTWDIMVDAGEQYEAIEDTLTVTSGGLAVSIEAELNRRFALPGWFSGDFHQHAMRSVDSEVDSRVRVMANIAAGLDIIAPSDHDIVENYKEIVENMGMDDVLAVYQGTEVSPLRGHINAFPTNYSDELEASGAPILVERDTGDPRTLRQRTTQEVEAEARANGVRVMQINHGRLESLALLDWVDFNPSTGEAQRRAEDLPLELEAMELYNAPEPLCVLMRDWHGFNLHGRRVVGMGNSDTHNLSAPSGWPRNYLYLGTGATPNDDTITEAIELGRVVVSGGIAMVWSEALPGDVVEPEDGVVELTLELYGDEVALNDGDIIIYYNGAEIERVDIATLDTSSLPATLDVEVPVEGDGFITVFAYSDDTISGGHLNGKRPFGIVNPLYVDADGNGYEAPGADGEVPLPDGIPFCADEMMFGPLERHSHGAGHTHSHGGHTHTH